MIPSEKAISYITLLQCIEIFKGSKNQKSLEHKDNPMYSRGAAYSRLDSERLFHNLVSKAILAEDVHVTAQDHIVMYLRPGKRAHEVLSGQLKIELQVKVSTKSTADKNIGNESSNPITKLHADCLQELITLAKELGKMYQKFLK